MSYCIRRWSNGNVAKFALHPSVAAKDICRLLDVGFHVDPTSQACLSTDGASSGQPPAHPCRERLRDMLKFDHRDAA